MATETDLYERLEQWLRKEWPDVIHHWDLSGLWTPSHKQRNLYGRLNTRAWPDLFIAVRGYPKSPYDEPLYGLFIELKKDGVVLYKKDGTLRANKHHREQFEMRDNLRHAGYAAEVVVGYDETIEIIDNYLRGQYEIKYSTGQQTSSNQF